MCKNDVVGGCFHASERWHHESCHFVLVLAKRLLTVHELWIGCCFILRHWPYHVSASSSSRCAGVFSRRDYFGQNRRDKNGVYQRYFFHHHVMFQYQIDGRSNATKADR